MSPQTKESGVVATLVVCLSVSTLFVLARFYSRFHLRIFRVEDWLMTLSWVLNICLTILTFFELKYSTRRQTSTRNATDNTLHFRFIYMTGLIYGLVLPITKLSICFLYQRVVDVEKLQKNLIRVLGVYLILTGIGFTGYAIFQCNPVSACWKDPSSAACLRTHTLSTNIMYAITASNIFTDLCIIAIVFPLVWKLQLELRTRLALNAVVCIGVFSMISSIVRIYILYRNLIPKRDQAWSEFDVDIWSCVECNTSLICAAAPCIRPFIIKVHCLLSPEYRRRMAASRQIEEYDVSENPMTAAHLKDFGHSATPSNRWTNTEVVTPIEDWE